MPETVKNFNNFRLETMPDIELISGLFSCYAWYESVFQIDIEPGFTETICAVAHDIPKVKYGTV